MPAPKTDSDRRYQRWSTSTFELLLNKVIYDNELIEDFNLKWFNGEPSIRLLIDSSKELLFSLVI